MRYDVVWCLIALLDLDSNDWDEGSIDGEENGIMDYVLAYCRGRSDGWQVGAEEGWFVGLTDGQPVGQLFADEEELGPLHK